MLLKNKNAIIYGAGGAIGSAVAHAFAREGARLFLAGRTLSSLAVVANQISRAGGLADIAEVDALNQDDVEEHLNDTIEIAGSVDISINVISLGDVHGTPVSQMQHEQFALPVFNAVTTQFFTATAAARQMAKQESGVILALTANAGHHPYPNVGGFGVACATIEAFCRQLAVEEGKHGIRVVCLRSAGSPDAPGVDEVFHQHAAAVGYTREQFETALAERTMLKRLPRLAEVANAAALAASDKASAITAAVMNITCGEIAD